MNIKKITLKDAEQILEELKRIIKNNNDYLREYYIHICDNKKFIISDRAYNKESLDYITFSPIDFDLYLKSELKRIIKNQINNIVLLINNNY